LFVIFLQVKVIMSVQSYPTVHEQVSEMLQLLTRQNDALVERFFSVLDDSGQSHVVDFILQHYNNYSYDNNESEPKTSVEEQSSNN